MKVEKLIAISQRLMVSKEMEILFLMPKRNSKKEKNTP
jgi:hypothetical protein